MYEDLLEINVFIFEKHEEHIFFNEKLCWTHPSVKVKVIVLIMYIYM